MKKSAEKIVELLNCEYELFENSTQTIIEDRYLELYKDGKINNYYPVIIEPSEVLYEALAENLGILSVKGLLDLFPDIDVKKFFKIKKSQYEYILEAQIPIGKFSKEEANDHLSTYIDFTTSYPFDEILILKIYTNKPWEILAYIPMGGYNNCPAPDYQVAIAKYWYEKYKAVPIVITSNTIEFLVGEPPQNYQDAEKLAYEHYSFCDELIINEIDSIRKLASILKDSTVWSFWWE